jgi:predicted MFS family arabinose efflux permease
MIAHGASRTRVVQLLVALIFLIFFQGFMVAPLLPRFAIVFDTDLAHVGALIPAYMLPYGAVCLVIGAIADRHGVATVLRRLLIAAAILPALCATAGTIDQLIAWRIVTGLGIGGIAPLALATIAQLYPYEERGRPLGWMYGAIAGGMAVGATVGPLLEPWLTWRGLFIAIGAACALVAVLLSRALGRSSANPNPASIPTLVRQYGRLVRTRRGATAYGYIFLNGVFHSGVFSWLGVYFTQRYDLAPREIGFALLGYGIPGFLLGPVIGRAADRVGRRPLILGGLVLAAICAFVLTASLPIIMATCVITLLSLGFDLTHPLFAGIVSSLDPARAAQAMALNTFAIFVGLGLGSLAFGGLYFAFGMTAALTIFGVLQLGLAVASVRLHRGWR